MDPSRNVAMSLCLGLPSFPRNLTDHKDPISVSQPVHMTSFRHCISLSRAFFRATGWFTQLRPGELFRRQSGKGVTGA